MKDKLTGKDMVKHISRLKAERNLYDFLFNDVKEYYIPSAGDFFYRKQDVGNQENEYQYSIKGTQAAERLAQVLYSTVMPIHEQFFTLVPSTETNHDMKLWWHNATEILSAKLAESNLPKVAVQLLRSLVYYGTAPIHPAWVKNKLTFSTYFPEDCYIDTDYDQEVDVLVTTKHCSAQNLVKKYGKQVSERVRNKAERSQANGAEDIVVYNYFKQCKDDVWRLYIVEEATKHIITEYAYSTKPIMVPRWSSNSYEKYGRSPAIRGLPTVKSLNRVKRIMMRASEKHVDPVIAIPVDAAANVDHLAFDINPGGYIEVMPDATGGMTLPQPIALGGNIAIGQEEADSLESMIDEIFYMDVLTLIMDMNTTATATQINSANAEKLDLMVPIIVQLLSDLVKPLVERSFQILMEEGEIPPPDFLESPEDLEYNVEVQSSLIMKMRQLKNMSAMQSIQLLANLANLDPSVIDRIDFDALAESIVINSNLPTDAIRSGRELEEYRVAKAEAAQQAAQQQMMSQMVKPLDAQKASEPGSLGDTIMDAVSG